MRSTLKAHVKTPVHLGGGEYKDGVVVMHGITGVMVISSDGDPLLPLPNRLDTSVSSLFPMPMSNKGSAVASTILLLDPVLLEPVLEEGSTPTGVVVDRAEKVPL